MFSLFRRRPPAPPAYQPPAEVEVVETYDGFMLRRAGTNAYVWIASGTPHWHRRDWDNHSMPGGYAYRLFRTTSLEKAQAKRDDVVQYMVRKAEEAHALAVEQYERKHFPERVVG